MRTTLHMMAVCGLVVVSAPQAFAQSSGVTSGPAAGSPATMGTGGQSASTPDQTNVLRNQGGAAVTNERAGQSGGTNGSVQPGMSDAGAGVHQGQKP